MSRQNLEKGCIKALVQLLGVEEDAIMDLLRRARKTGPDDDPISAWYQARISRTIGRRTGQVYTPSSIAFLMASLASSSDVKKVLDPACGCGTFLRSVMLSTENVSSLDMIGYEQEEIPAMLALLNVLSLQERGKGPHLRIEHADFFDSEHRNEMDLIIGNPPYIRQELLASKDDVRRRIEEMHGHCHVSRRSDLYAYFIESSTRALKEGGRLAFIIPDKWMDVGYGESLKRFLLENFIMETILTFDANVFDRALVDTVIIIFRKCGDRRTRASTMMRLVKIKVKDEVGPRSLSRIRESGRTKINKDLDVVLVRQGILEPKARWSHLLKAPAIFKEVLGSKRTRCLKEIETIGIRRGVTTNLTKFFFPSESRRKELRIPGRYLAPAVKSPKDIHGLILRQAPDRLLLIPKDRKGGTVPEGLTRVMAWANRRIWGRDGRKKVDQLPSFKGKGTNWYSLRTDAPGEILVPKFVRQGRPRFIANKVGAHASDTFQYINVRKKNDLEVILGSLNSILGAISCELVGRVEGRGLLQLMTYELGDVLVLDPAGLSKKERREVVLGYMALVDEEGPEMLDIAIVKALGHKAWKGRLRSLREAYERLYVGRLAKARTKVPVRTQP